jgi:hypothetical protein
MKQYADLNLTGHTLSDFLLTSSTALTAAGKMRYNGGKYYGFTTEEVAFLLKSDEKSLSVASAAQLTESRKLWGNSFNGTADVSGDITLGSGKKIYFGSTGYYIELVDGNLHTNVGFYSDAFISARGKDSSGSSGGGADLEAVWESLTGTVAPYASSVINVAHIPDLSISKITGLQSDLNTLTSGISAINAKIPSAATSTNQLADKAFVNSSISTATAAFAGTVTSLAALKALEGDLNDYAFYSYTDTAGNTVYARYKYDPDYSSTDTGHWKFEYNLNNSSFTSAQWSAINSGITTTLVSKLGNIADSAQVNVIETVKVNGTALTVSSKAVNVTVATGSNSGTIAVNGADVSVKGLGSFAYRSSLAFSELSSHPTTLSGYGITDGVNGVTSSGSGNAVTSLSVSDHTLTYTLGSTFFTTAGNGLTQSGATVSAKVDSSGEFLSVSAAGLKVSGVKSAISSAVYSAVFMSSTHVTSGTSAAITVTGTIKGVTTQYGGAECICEVTYSNSNKTVTVSWGFSATSSAPMTINVFYVK